MDDQPPMLPLLNVFLSGHDAPCPSCGYNLRGLLTSRCPECSQELKLSVDLVEHRMRLWLTAVIAMAFGAGFNILLLIYVLVQVFRNKFPTSSGFWMQFTTHNVVGILVQGLGLAFLLARGKRIRRWNTRSRLALCALAAALTLANVIIFALTIR